MTRLTPTSTLWLTVFLLLLGVPDLEAGVPDTPFQQEVHLPYPPPSIEGAEDVRAIAVDKEGRIWAGTQAGPYVLNMETKEWEPGLTEELAGPVFDLSVARDGAVWMAAWNGIFSSQDRKMFPHETLKDPLSTVVETADGILAFGPRGRYLVAGSEVSQASLNISRDIREVLPGEGGRYWIATGMGLYRWSEQDYDLYQSNDEILSSAVTSLEYAQDGSLWVGCFGGISVFRHGKWIETYKAEDGLPSIEVQCLTKSPDGSMWVGTTHGVVRFEGDSHSLRHSRRWLLDDDVRDVAFDSRGNPWIATAGGVSCIEVREMTLADKADYFLDVLYRRHVREPWFVEKCRLPNPGDVSVWEPEDDDNDGEYTGNYLVMESFRFAVTGDPEAKRNADRAFDALKRLETINDIPGFFARTIIPATWERMNDGNRTYSERELAELAVRDPRYKPVEERWRESADGKWLWKGDTSSDEMTGHFFAYHYYHDLAADATKKAEVGDHVARIMDHLIEHDYCLVDIDGTHTRWGVWSPDRLNDDPDWRAERNINALELLSYLKVTHAITGDDKYQREYVRLIRDHHFLAHASQAKTYARAWNTRIDDSLLVETFPGLLKFETDPGLLKVYRHSMDRWYDGVQADQSPFFNFVYGSFSGGDPKIEDSVFFLRDCPLDLVNWRVDNRQREDLELTRSPILEEVSTEPLPPPSERCVMRWDKNPWMAAGGDGGHTEWAPTFWLMPYWMGRYYGFIEAPGAN